MLFTIELRRWPLSLAKFTLNGNVETFFDSTFADSLNRFYCYGTDPGNISFTNCRSIFV